MSVEIHAPFPASNPALALCRRDPSDDRLFCRALFETGNLRDREAEKSSLILNGEHSTSYICNMHAIDMGELHSGARRHLEVSGAYAEDSVT